MTKPLPPSGQPTVAQIVASFQRMAAHASAEIARLEAQPTPTLSFLFAFFFTTAATWRRTRRLAELRAIGEMLDAFIDLCPTGYPPQYHPAAARQANPRRCRATHPGRSRTQAAIATTASAPRPRAAPPPLSRLARAAASRAPPSRLRLAPTLPDRPLAGRQSPLG